MRVNVVQIGNSKGIRIPKPVLQQTGIESEVEIEVRGEQLIIRPAAHARAGWAEAFARMAECEEDKLLDPEQPTEWDRSEWRW